VLGSYSLEDGVYTTLAGEVVGVHPNMAKFMESRTFLSLGEGEDCVNGCFEVEMFADPEKDLSIGMFTCGGVPVMHWTNHAVDPSAWSISSLLPFRWNIREGKSFMTYGRIMGNKRVSEDVEVKLNYGEFNRFRYETTAEEMRLFINGELVQVVPVPTFPRSAVSAEMTEDEILVKLVNIANEETAIELNFDVDVESDFTVISVDGDPETSHSFDNPRAIWPREGKGTGAAKSFTYTAPASCVQVLRFKKA